MLTVVVSMAAASGDTLAKVSSELRTLYAQYLVRTGGGPLVVTDPLIQIVEDRVVVDAVAADGVDHLRASLVALGMEQAVTAGRIVSGQLPIAKIPEMAALPDLKFAQAAMSTTQRGSRKEVR